ncbi:hypothetical protein BBP13_07945 [Limosilactobacillus reuteri]|nr:hypothetical protein BBP13_07945 [Limosilactobacillus reuteri]
MSSKKAYKKGSETEVACDFVFEPPQATIGLQCSVFAGIHFLVWMKILCQIFYTKKRTFAVPSLYNQFTTKIMKEG